MDVLLGQWCLQVGQHEGEEHQEAGGQKREGAEHHQVRASCEGAESTASQTDYILPYLEGGILHTVVGQSPRC
jgi:hypothetical protein